MTGDAFTTWSKTLIKVRLLPFHRCIHINELAPRSLRKAPLNQKLGRGASQVAQWLRVCLPMQGTWVHATEWLGP